MNIMKFCVVVISSILLLTANVATARDISMVQPGDDNLSCKRLAAETVKMEKLITKTQDDIESKKNMREGANAARQQGIGSSIPFLGSAINALSRSSARSEGDKRRLVSQAKSRKNHVTRLFNKKKCSSKTYRDAQAKVVDGGSSKKGGFFGSLFGSKERKAISTANVNIRKGPSTSNPVVGKLRAGEEVKVNSTSGGWMQVSTSNVKGWVSEKYMRKVN